MKKQFVVVDVPSALHISNGNETSEVLLKGNVPIIISKEYGPACFSNLKVTACVDDNWYWKIEMMNNATGEYEEMLRLRHEICYPESNDE